MGFLTNEKLTIVGAGGMIGSNMAQTAVSGRGVEGCEICHFVGWCCT